MFCFSRAGADDTKCVEAISSYKLPKCDLLDECEELNGNKIGSYRRLLPAHYADGLSKVYIFNQIEGDDNMIR